MGQERRFTIQTWPFAVFVPPGDHRIVFRFRPAPLLPGALVTLLTAFSLRVGIYWSEQASPRMDGNEWIRNGGGGNRS
jgi:hypothetical protein